MSKKKFKKKKNKKHSQQVYVAPKPSVAQETGDSETDDSSVEEVVEAPVKTKKSADAVIPAADEQEYAYVRKDVKKILIVMGSIVALLIIAFIVNDKTTLFHSMGNWLYNMLHIQTQ